jgi:hypothetical protein
MPAYKNRPLMASDTPMWRYLTLSGVIATIETRSLRLTRVDRFQDAFEGSVPKAQIKSETLPLIGAASRQGMMVAQGVASSTSPTEDPWSRITRLRPARTRSAHASCWSAGDESEPLWRAYCVDDGLKGVGVALWTTLARLEASVAAHDLYVSPITYIPYLEAPPFRDEMDPLLHKRHAFVAERELRLLKFDQAHFNASLPRDASVPELPEHIDVPWVFGDVVEEIVVSPYASVDYEALVHRAINAKDPGLAHRVVLSELHERRNPPDF